MKSAPAIMQTIDGPRDVAQRLEVAGGQDRLQMRIAAGGADRRDLVVERAPVAGQHMLRAVMTMSISRGAVADRRIGSP